MVRTENVTSVATAMFLLFFTFLSANLPPIQFVKAPAELRPMPTPIVLRSFYFSNSLLSKVKLRSIWAQKFISWMPVPFWISCSLEVTFRMSFSQSLFESFLEPLVFEVLKNR
jgi:hypothetical protein